VITISKPILYLQTKHALVR